MIFSTLAALALTAQATQTLPSNEVLAQIKTELLEMEGVADVSVALTTENKTVWQLQSYRLQPLNRYYDACRTIARNGAMADNIDVMFVSDLAAMAKSKTPEDYSMGRFNCASWAYYAY